jgi:hypothetical protein
MSQNNRSITTRISNRFSKYFYSKVNDRFTDKNDKLNSNQLIYAVFNTKSSLKVKTLNNVKELFLDHLKEQKALGLVPKDFNYLKFFNLNQKAIKKVGRVFHIDFICDGKNLPREFFNN